MSEESHSKSQPDDAFKDLPLLKTRSGDTKKTDLFKQEEKTSTQNEASDIKKALETGTKINVGKKLMETGKLNTKSKLKDTTLGGVSIDTDYNIKPEKKNVSAETTRLNLTTIESTGRQLVIEEDSIKPLPDVNIPQNPNKKEKLSAQNLSIDISSGILATRLPLEDDRIQLGSGIISGILGTGGMAKVYKIWNDKLEIFRAVKLLLPTHDQEAFKRFQTEVKISAKLKHPNIIEIHSVGEWQGLPYMEMELVEGEPLNNLISRYKVLPSFLSSSIALLVARALAYAHYQEIQIYGKKYKGIIHRDLKPSNIMIGPTGTVKLMDFGVARPVETGLHTVNTDSIVGTVHYFSPEQIQGYPVNQLSDIYSFGAVLYEMLCGSNPFPYSTIADLIQAKLKNQFTHLGDYNLCCDPRLSSVAQICLRTHKSTRIQNSMQLRDYLEEVHNSLEIGTPEKVITDFYNNPEEMYKENERMYKKVSRPVSQTQSDTIKDEPEQVNTPENTSNSPSTKTLKQIFKTAGSGKIFIISIIILFIIIIAILVMWGMPFLK
jgi:serine/threonine protein kinase